MSVATDAPVVPSIPSTPVFQASTGGTVTVAWSPGASNGGAPITSYELQVATEFCCYTQFVTSATPQVLIPRLEAQASFLVTVRAQNVAGSSDYSDVLKVETGKSSEPGPVDGLAAHNVTDSSLQLVWRTPLDFGGIPVEAYDVSMSSNGGASWQSLASVPARTEAQLGHPGGPVLRDFAYAMEVDDLRASTRCVPAPPHNTRTHGTHARHARTARTHGTHGTLSVFLLVGVWPWSLLATHTRDDLLCVPHFLCLHLVPGTSSM